MSGLWRFWDGGPTAPELAPIPEPVPQPPLVVPAAKPVTARGTLFVDAQPWGQLAELRDAAGQAVALPANPMTPLQVSLPVGTYRSS